MKKNFVNILAFSGFSFVLFLLIVSILMFAFNLPVMSLNFLLANLFSFVLAGFLFKDFKLSFLAHLLNFVLIFVLALYFSGTKDFNYDSLWYHIPAIDLIKEGWNPLNLDTAYSYPHDWVKFFPKAPWIIYANLASFFNNFEAGKLANSFLIFISAFFAYFALRQFEIKKSFCILLAICFALNPVSLMQSHSFLVDGFLSSALLILISSIVLYVKTKDIKTLVVFAFALILSINVKLSASAYIFVILSGSLFWLKEDKKFLSTALIAGLIGLFAIGFNPYSVNLIKHKNPIYPLGSKDTDIIQNSCPKKFEGKNRVNKLVVSIFSSMTREDDEIQLKMPFSITKTDLKYAHTAQPKAAGFGFLFSGVVVLCLVFAALSFKKRGFRELAIFETVVLISVLLNPECWWARFVPQFYILPLAFAAFLLIEDEDKKYKIFGLILTFVICLNILVTGAFHLFDVLKNQAVQNLLTVELRHFGGTVYVSKNDPKIDGIRIRLKTNGIEFKELPDYSCKGQVLNYSTIRLCLVPRE